MNQKIVVPAGKLALDPSQLKRKKLADDLKNGRPLSLGSSGDVTGKEQTKLITQEGKLAAQWYEADPELLEAEKVGMRRFFPQFDLQVVDSPESRYHNCLCWVGDLKPGIMDDVTWNVMAVYRPNHPTPCMGGSVCVYLVDPGMDQVKAALGYVPHHVLNDGRVVCICVLLALRICHTEDTRPLLCRPSHGQSNGLRLSNWL